VEAQSELQALGQSRDNPLKQRQYLQGVVAQFQTAAESALSGHYSSSPLLRENVMKLRKRIFEANEEFANKMLIRGHEVEFKKVEKVLLMPNTSPSTPPDAVAPGDPVRPSAAAPSGSRDPPASSFSSGSAFNGFGGFSSLNFGKEQVGAPLSTTTRSLIVVQFVIRKEFCLLTASASRIPRKTPRLFSHSTRRSTIGSGRRSPTTEELSYQAHLILKSCRRYSVDKR
jgi:hypothetical protein